MKLPHSCYTLHGEELVAVLYLCICGCTSLPDPEKPEYYQHRCLIPYHSKEKLSEIQWAAFILLCAGCTIAQLNPLSDHVLQTPIQGDGSFKWFCWCIYRSKLTVYLILG